jgi:hypothetical protein
VLARRKNENNLWSELFRLFTSKNVYLSWDFLEELHALRLIQELIENFVAARQLSNHPIAVSHWDKKPDPWQEVED